MGARAAARRAVGLAVAAALLGAGGCRQPRSRVEALSPELAELEGRGTGQPRGAEPPARDGGEARLIYRHSRNDERARLASASDALARLALIDAQIEQEKAARP